MGSEKGTPSSMMSAPPSCRANKTSTVSAGSGYPAVTYATNAGRPGRGTANDERYVQDFKVHRGQNTPSFFASTNVDLKYFDMFSFRLFPIAQNREGAWEKQALKEIERCRDDDDSCATRCKVTFFLPFFGRWAPTRETTIHLRIPTAKWLLLLRSAQRTSRRQILVRQSLKTSQSV